MRYDALVISPVRELLTQIVNFVPTILVALGILIIGYVMAKTLSKVFNKLFEAINLDKLIGKIGISEFLRKGGIKHKPSELLSSLIYWIVMAIVLIITVKSIGLTMATVMLNGLLAYIPKVISGVFILILGMLLAKVVSGLVEVIAFNTDLPHPELLGHVSKLAIVIHVTIVFLKELGYGGIFTGIEATILFGGVVFALALAFGLGGKEAAAKYLDVFKIKKNGR